MKLDNAVEHTTQSAADLEYVLTVEGPTSRLVRAWGNLIDWAGPSISSGAAGGSRPSGTSDGPVISEVIRKENSGWVEDINRLQLAELEELVTTIEVASKRMKAIVLQSTLTSWKQPEVWTICCENCAEVVPEGKRTWEGRCDRCRKWFDRKGLDWPKYRTDGRSAG